MKDNWGGVRLTVACLRGLPSGKMLRESGGEEGIRDKREQCYVHLVQMTVLLLKTYSKGSCQMV